jgi:geranylgeranyl pyrophosphate synthase
MAKKKKAAVAAGAVTAARSNPYVQRVIEDDEIRDNVRVAFEAARDAYDRLSSGKSTGKTLTDDKKFHKDLQTAAEALKDAGASLREGPKKKRRGGLGRKLLLLVVAGGAALALSSDLRSKVLDALFGAEEEFDYTSTTAPSAAPTAGSAA